MSVPDQNDREDVVVPPGGAVEGKFECGAGWKVSVQQVENEREPGLKNVEDVEGQKALKSALAAVGGDG